MATRALEARFERMSVNDENETRDGSKYTKKVSPYFPPKIQDNPPTFIANLATGCGNDNSSYNYNYNNPAFS
jgi:hypothetical protein